MHTVVALAATIGLACAGSVTGTLLWRSNSDGDTIDVQGRRLTDKYSFYHTSDALAAAAAALKSGDAPCPGLTLDAEADGDVTLPVVRLAALGATTTNASSLMDMGAEQADAAAGDDEIKVMLVFGEHARELISPEIGLHFLQELCGPRGSSARRSTSFLMVLNANPRGRGLVENGQLCKRTNGNNVDLNRNYGFHWKAEHANDDVVGVGAQQGVQMESFSSGSGPFSEPETRIISRLMREARPDVFLDVHSGRRGLYMPPDWTTDPISNEADKEAMQSVLEEIRTHDCPECTMGALSETIGYLAPGSSADYAYSQGIKFAFIWEIYADAKDSSEDLQAQQAFLRRKRQQQGQEAGASSMLQLHRLRASGRGGHRSKLLGDVPAWAQQDELEVGSLAESAVDHCFRQFNPPDQETYDSTLERWSTAFLRLCDSVRQRRARSSAAP